MAEWALQVHQLFPNQIAFKSFLLSRKVLGKAVEYTRGFFKKRKHRLGAEQAGLKSLKYIGGLALRRGSEMKFGGEEQDEVESGGEGGNDEEEGEEEELGKKKKRAKTSPTPCRYDQRPPQVSSSKPINKDQLYMWERLMSDTLTEPRRNDKNSPCSIWGVYTSESER